MGHQNSGAVTAAIGGGDNGYNINHLLSHITPAMAAAGDGADVNAVVKTNAELTVAELSARSTIVRDAIDAGKLEVVAAYYELETGQVQFL